MSAPLVEACRDESPGLAEHWQEGSNSSTTSSGGGGGGSSSSSSRRDFDCVEESLGSEMDDDDFGESIVFTRSQSRATPRSAPKLPYVVQFDAAIRRHVAQHTPTDEVVRARQRVHEALVRLINANISPFYNGHAPITVSCFGSSAYNLDIVGSDLDYSIHLSRPPRGTAEVSKLLETLIAPLHDLPGLVFCEAKLRQRCPVLTFRLYGLECDLSIAASPAAEQAKTRLVTSLGQCDARFRPVLMLVKHWAKERGLSDAVAGYLNSFGWMLLVVQYLQSRGVLPVCQPLAARSATAMAFLALPPAERFRVLGPAEAASSSSSGVGGKANESVSELLEAFFDWAADLSWGDVCISVRLGRPVPSAPYLAPPTLGGFSSPYPPCLCIEDPFDPQDNVARGVRREALRAISAGIASAQDALRRHRTSAGSADGLDPLAALLAPGTLVAAPLPRPEDRRCQQCQFGARCRKAGCAYTHPHESCLHGIQGGGGRCPWHAFWLAQREAEE